MKKIGLLIFGAALIVGVIIANFANIAPFGSTKIKSPLSFVFGSKIHGSGNVVTESRNTGDFDGVDVGGILNVVITKADKVSVVVEADDNIVPIIKTEVKNGILNIWSEKRFKTKSAATIRISAPNVKSIDSSGVAHVSYSGIAGDSLEIESSGASKIVLKGSVESLDVDMSGASKINAKELVANKAEIDGSGAASVAVEVTSSIRADVSGASSVDYTGDPTDLKKSVSGAGSVNKIK